jgi:hypothetical protein
MGKNRYGTLSRIVYNMPNKSGKEYLKVWHPSFTGVTVTWISRVWMSFEGPRLSNLNLRLETVPFY